MVRLVSCVVTDHHQCHRHLHRHHQYHTCRPHLAMGITFSIAIDIIHNITDATTINIAIAITVTIVLRMIARRGVIILIMSPA